MVSIQHTNSDQVTDGPGPQANWFALGIVTFVFFMWGFLTSLNDVLIPHLKSLFSLNYAQSMLVQFTFFGAYFVMSLPCGKLVSRLGYKHSIALGLLIAACGALLFYPAAGLPSYALFLAAFFTLATGITLLQVAANPYVSLLGAARSAATRLNLVQAFNSLGTTLAPKVGGVLILSATVLGAAEIAGLTDDARLAYRMQQAQLVQGPYLGLAITLAALALLFYVARLPSMVDDKGAADAHTHRFIDALRHPNLRFGIGAIFVYVGAEVAIGSFLINYISQADIGNIAQAQAANYVAFYWGGAMVGRFIGAALMRTIAPRRLLAAVVDHDPESRPARGVERRGNRPVQLDHVSHHFHTRHRAPRATDRSGLQSADHGYRRWRGDSGAAGYARRSRWYPARICAAAVVLRLYWFLRYPRLARRLSWNYKLLAE
jgi:FHS family L-fucose permease-like MFS transporter